jgi:hypothetical protein
MAWWIWLPRSHSLPSFSGNTPRQGNKPKLRAENLTLLFTGRHRAPSPSLLQPAVPTDLVRGRAGQRRPFSTLNAGVSGSSSSSYLGWDLPRPALCLLGLY